MSDFSIRLYNWSDHEVARDLFVQGILEHVPVTFYRSLRLSPVWIFMVCASVVSFLISGSIAISMLAVTSVLALLYLNIRSIFYTYLEQCLCEDMKDIHKYYLQREGSCFWVAESAGQVVATVAAIPSSHPLGIQCVELKRLSVLRSQRGNGIAKALCRTVIDFAQGRGCESVILETSVVQTDAQRLYENMGFRLIRTYYIPDFIASFIDFKELVYQYDI
ncbi:probable N-acetyltransferase CML1 [Bombina bombina]|uniref:probable N-acetyltransferase CML1 n=1 Tax=Bombina bombina TaxID=8345 RepID=UPI00235AF690|nr:probable N-acetyltransferase CML1 [Bombina bombina]